MNKERDYFFDNLKAVLIFLVASFSKDSLAGFYVIRGFSPSAEG